MPVIFCQRRIATSTYSGSNSITRAIRPVLSAARMVVPLPPNGSRMTPLRRLQSRIKSAISARLHRWMEFKITAPRRIKAVDAGVIKNIGTVPALTAEFEVVDVRSGPALEDRNELVFPDGKSYLAGITLVPNQEVFPFRIEYECGTESSGMWRQSMKT